MSGYASSWSIRVRDMGHTTPSSSGSDSTVFWTGAAIAAVCLAGFLAWGWYAAGVQRDVWARQGCSMSQWEVFMGAKPIERNFVNPEK